MDDAILDNARGLLDEYDRLYRPLKDACIEVIEGYVRSCEGEEYSFRDGVMFISVVGPLGEIMDLRRLVYNELSDDTLLELVPCEGSYSDESLIMPIEECMLSELAIICEHVLKVLKR